MDRAEFNKTLKEVGLSKKEFCEKIELNYNTVNNWGTKNIGIPKWVESWLGNYRKAKISDEIISAVRPFVDK